MEVLKKFESFNNHKTKEECEYLKNYSVYCAMCNTHISRLYFYEHTTSKKHLKADKTNIALCKTINNMTGEEVCDKDLQYLLR